MYYNSRIVPQRYSGKWRTIYPTPGNGSWGGNYSSVFDLKGGYGVYGWRRAAAARVDAGSQYVRTHHQIEQEDGEIALVFHREDFAYKWDSLSSGHYQTGYNFIPPASNSTILNSLLGQCETDFLNKVYQTGTTFSGGTFLGELAEAVRSIRHPADALKKQIVNYVQRVSRYRRNKGVASIRALNKAVAGTYLEATYGWIPLVHDIDDAAKAAARRLNYYPPSIRLFSSKTTSFTQTKDLGAVDDGGNLGFYYDHRESHDIQVKYFGGFLTRSDFSGGMTDFGLGFRNFVPTVWNLIPYSFVADYFTNIGDVINGLSAATSQLWYCGRSYKYTRSRVFNPTREFRNIVTGYPIKVDNSSISPNKYRISVVDYVRTPIVPGTLSPSFRVNVPTPKQGFNIGALIAQSQAVSRLLTS
jgi:hypothetical protein